MSHQEAVNLVAALISSFYGIVLIKNSKLGVRLLISTFSLLLWSRVGHLNSVSQFSRLKFGYLPRVSVRKLNETSDTFKYLGTVFVTQ